MKKTAFSLFLCLPFCQIAIAQNDAAAKAQMEEEMSKFIWEGSFTSEIVQKKELKEAYSLPASDVDYEGFRELSDQVYEYRKGRLVGLADFLKMSGEPNTIILDTRSKSDFDQIHLAGAVHLNFSEFTEDKLARIIPSTDTRILIYCNNNFKGTPYFFPSKRITLALNIPTFINLYGYGYQNIYELKDLLPFPTDLVKFEGKHVPKN